MSGGVGPTSGGDIRLPKEDSDDDGLPPPPHSPRRRFLSFRQLNALAVAIVLAASGMVAAADLAFAALSLAYLHLLSSVAFPLPPNSPPPPPVFAAGGNRLLTPYVAAGAALGLLLPVAYILDGVLAGDPGGVAAAAPHVFLLAAQVFLEGVTFAGGFSLPMRAFVPISYNTNRLFALADWVRHELEKGDTGNGVGSPAAARRVVAGRALAVANLAFWSFNLFGFLLPVYLPKALQKHYCGHNKKP